MSENTLYYGDNLDILRRYIANESVDLVYLDPPFKSDQDYNVLFAEKDGSAAAAQIKAFEDTWQWDQMAAAQYQETVEQGGRVADVLLGFRQFLASNDMLAYLPMMAPRLVELRRVLRNTGSIYLHCDPTASHYLKLLLDAVFGPEQFRNEIIWKRSHAHNTANRYGANHDVILFYGKTEKVTWNTVYQEYDEEYLAKHYRHVDSQGRRYKHENPTGAGVSKGVRGQPWRGINPTVKGRHWARTPEELEKLDREGLIHWPGKRGAWPYIKLYLEDMKGIPAQDTWTDIDVINSSEPRSSDWLPARDVPSWPGRQPPVLLGRRYDCSRPRHRRSPCEFRGRSPDTLVRWRPWLRGLLLEFATKTMPLGEGERPEGVGRRPQVDGLHSCRLRRAG
jgi:site-specific DNA-methyltransferase (adenine-specific)